MQRKKDATLVKGRAPCCPGMGSLCLVTQWRTEDTQPGSEGKGRRGAGSAQWHLALCQVSPGLVPAEVQGGFSEEPWGEQGRIGASLRLEAP